MTCDETDISNIQCESMPDKELLSSLSDWKAKKYSQSLKRTLSIAWTDGKNHVLILSCNEDDLMSWYVKSKKKRLSKKTKQFILEKVEGLGLDSTKAVELSHKNC